jgi:hypothetical protein
LEVNPYNIHVTLEDGRFVSVKVQEMIEGVEGIGD